MINIDFDVIVLSDIWSVNIDFYANILPGYNFCYDLPMESKVGGIRMFIKSNRKTHELVDYRLPFNTLMQIENKWFEITKNKNTYIIGGILTKI